MAEVEELCTAVTIVNHGRVVFSGTVDELRVRAPAAMHALQTSDDAAAFSLALEWPRVRVAHGTDGGLTVAADVDALDAYVIALGRAGVAIRTLERRARPLESLFLELTADADRGDAAARVSSAEAECPSTFPVAQPFESARAADRQA